MCLHLCDFKTEALRKWPPAILTDRRCNKRYVITNDDAEDRTNNASNSRPLILEEGDEIMIPIFGLHRDPQYYPDPERFDPERFSETNRHNIQANTYMPFGAGPRNCIASRFALMQVKAFLFEMVSTFKFEVHNKSRIPMRLVQNMFTINAEGGYNVHLKPRA